jgi:hypothetical protein
LHWHGFIHSGKAFGEPGAAGRAERLAPGDGAVLCTPHAVAGWVTRRSAESGRDVLLLDQVSGRWCLLGDTSNTDRVRLEVLLVAARGESVSAAPQSILRDCYISVEAVNSEECTRHDYFVKTLADHCRGR